MFGLVVLSFRVQNCSKTIDEIVKPEVCLDDAYLEGFLKVLEANMYCHHHINRRHLKYVAQWKLSIFEIRKKAGSKMMPSIESNASGRSRSQTGTPDARETRRYSTKNNNTLISQNRGLPAEKFAIISSRFGSRSSRILAEDL